MLEEITQSSGRSSAYGADFETDTQAGYKPIVRDTVRYTVAQDEPVAAHMVVAVRTRVANLHSDPASVTVTLRLPTGAVLEHAVTAPTTTSPITWEFDLQPEGQAGEEKVLVNLIRLPDATGLHEITTTLDVRAPTAGTVGDATAQIQADHDRQTARDDLETALTALEAAVAGDPFDEPRVQQVRDRITEADGLIANDDGTKATADAVINKLVLAYVYLVQVENHDIGPTCEALTRLYRYWGWEYTTRDV